MTDHQKFGAVLIIFVLSVMMTQVFFLSGYSAGYSVGSQFMNDARGYIGCKDGLLTMKNFFVDSVKSEAFHFGLDPCNGKGAAITVGEQPKGKP